MLRKEQSNRLKKVSVRIAVVILTGLLYFVITSILGYGIPCPIRLITGLQCPGCGVSRMLSSIIKLNFTDAFDYHPVLFTSLPFLAIIFSDILWQYIYYGKYQLRKWENVIMIAIIVCLVAFCIIRNVIIFRYC